MSPLPKWITAILKYSEEYPINFTLHGYFGCNVRKVLQDVTLDVLQLAAAGGVVCVSKNSCNEKLTVIYKVLLKNMCLHQLQ